MNTDRMFFVAGCLGALLMLACEDSPGAAGAAGQSGQAGQGAGQGGAGSGQGGAGQSQAGQSQGGAGQAGEGGGPAGSAGQGAGQGGAACTPWAPGASGASSIAPTVPTAGLACPIEGFELCTGPLFNAPAALSKCVGGVWSTPETGAACSGGYQECNLGSNPIVDANCCTGAARLCGDKFCDGTRWWLPGSSN